MKAQRKRATCYQRLADGLSTLLCRESSRHFFSFFPRSSSVAHFVAFEVRSIDTLGLLRPLTRSRPWAMVTVGRMEMVIYVTPQLGRVVTPRPAPRKTPHTNHSGPYPVGAQA